jgi:predicted ATPase
MEKLIVKNFLTVQDIELDIKKINVIIGRQAEGKSILAKLVYFFNT